MSVTCKVPELRFPEFSGEWEEKKLIETVDKNVKWSFTGGPFGSDLKSDDYTEDGVRIIQLQNIGDGSFLNDYAIYTSEDKADQLLSCNIYSNEIILSKMGDPVARACKMPLSDKRYLMASDGIRYVPDEKKYSKDFLFFSINHPSFRKQAIVNSTGSTRKRIGLTELRNLKFNVPSKQEQEKIASFFSSVDSKIEQLGKKKTLLEQYKKGVMQKIFSQELRFHPKGTSSLRSGRKIDDGSEFPEWESFTLGEVAKFRRGSFPQPYGLPEWYDDENGLPFVQVFDVNDNMRLKSRTKNKISKLAQPSSVFVEKGNIVLTIQGSIGRIALTQYDAYVDRTLLIFTDYLKAINKQFFVYVIYLLFEIEKRKAPGGTIKTITKEALTSFLLKLPCLDEQTKIANFLSSLDKKIELTDKELEATKEFKKGLLQKMFV
jgi:type I restriction enzyme S subunit